MSLPEDNNENTNTKQLKAEEIIKKSDIFKRAKITV
jgi:hypothetical protein